MPTLRCGAEIIEWVNMFKYLGYGLTTKLGWGNIISKTRIRIRQQTAMINSIKFAGATSRALRRILFSTFVLPFFTWIAALYPLFTETQRSGLRHFYYTSLKRVYRCLCWEDMFFASFYGERSLDDICYRYWTKYCKALTKSRDGYLLAEQLFLNTHRLQWEEGKSKVHCVRRSKRFVPHLDILGLATRWMSSHGTEDSVAVLDEKDLESFKLFPETF